MRATKLEMHQMGDRVVFHPIKGGGLTSKQKNGALRVIMFFKKKDVVK